MPLQSFSKFSDLLSWVPPFLYGGNFMRLISETLQISGVRKYFPTWEVGGAFKTLELLSVIASLTLFYCAFFMLSQLTAGIHNSSTPTWSTPNHKHFLNCKCCNLIGCITGISINAITNNIWHLHSLSTVRCFKVR